MSSGIGPKTEYIEAFEGEYKSFIVCVLQNKVTNETVEKVHNLALKVTREMTLCPCDDIEGPGGLQIIRYLTLANNCITLEMAMRDILKGH